MNYIQKLVGIVLVSTFLQEPPAIATFQTPKVLEEKHTQVAQSTAVELHSNISEVSEENFEQDVIKQNQLVLIVFAASWCDPCRMFMPVVEEVARIYAGQIKVVKIDTDRMPNIAARYGIRSLPTSMLFKEGKSVGMIVGAGPKSIIVSRIEEYLHQSKSPSTETLKVITTFPKVEQGKPVEPVQPITAEEFFNNGSSKISEGNYKNAIADFTEAIRLNPYYAAAYYYRGLSYTNLKDNSKAIANFNQALQLIPTYTEAFFQRGLSYSNLGQKQKAIADYLKVIQLSGQKRIDRGDKERAIKLSSELLKTNLDFAEAYYQGLAYFYLSDIESNDQLIHLNTGSNQALKQVFSKLDLSIQLNTKIADAYYYRGIAQSTTERAIADYTQSIQLDPQLANAYYKRAHIHAYQNNLQTAIQDYTQTIQINPNFAEAYYQRGLILSQLKDEEKAIKDYQEYLRRDLAPDIPYPEAIEDYIQALQIKPQDADSYYQRGLARHALKDYSGAIRDFSQAIRLNPKMAEAYFARSQAYPQHIDFLPNLDAYHELLADYDRAIRFNLNLAEAYLTRGLFRIGYPTDWESFGYGLDPEWQKKLSQGNDAEEKLLSLKVAEVFRKSINDYTKAIQLNPNLAEAYIARASARFLITTYDSTVNIHDVSYWTMILEDVKQAIRLGWNHKVQYFENRLHDFGMSVTFADLRGEESFEAIMKDSSGRLLYEYFVFRGKYSLNPLKLKAEQKAIARYQQLLKSDSSNADTHYNLGLLYLKRGELKKAIASFTEAIKINDRDRDSYYNRALARYSLRNYQEAIADYTTAIQLTPDIAESYYYGGRAFARYDSGDYKGAISDAEKALKIDPQDARAMIARDLTQTAMGNPSQDITALSQIWGLPIPPFGGSALAAQETNADRYYADGRRLARQGDKQGAIKSLQHAANLFLSKGNTSRYQETIDLMVRLKQ
jgi:thioredoxin